MQKGIVPPLLRVAAPPYDSCVRSPIVSEYEEGTVVIAEQLPLSRSPQDTLQPLVPWFRQFRARHRGIVLAATLSDPADPAAHAALRLLTVAGVRLVLAEPVEKASLRRTVSVAGLSQTDLNVWLTHCLRPRGLVEHGLLRTLTRITCGEGLDEPTVVEARRWTKKLGLPGMHSWGMVGRLVRALTVLQGCPDVTISSVVREFGLADSATFSHACRRLFDQAPSQIREKVGWEWLLVRFLNQHRRSQARGHSVLAPNGVRPQDASPDGFG